MNPGNHVTVLTYINTTLWAIFVALVVFLYFKLKPRVIELNSKVDKTVNDISKISTSITQITKTLNRVF